MLYAPRSATVLALTAVLVAGCGSDPNDPGEAGLQADQVRTLLIHRQNTGENELWDTDGTAAGTLPSTRGMLPIGVHPGVGTIALLAGNAIVETTLDRSDDLDTLIHPVPQSMSLASFSSDARYLAIVAYAPSPGLLLYDRANRLLDTLDLGGADPALPPVFAPGDDRIVLITVTDLSILATFVYPDDPGNTSTRQVRASRLLNRPIFGWPRWIGNGLRMAFVRVAESGPDTLMVGTIFPDNPSSFLQEHYRALMAPANDPDANLDIGLASTYALTADGSTLALGAIPGDRQSPHTVYVVTQDSGRVRVLVDGPGENPVFPLFIRE
jgi:hypothetical protein